jgi:STELLO glycosyltransferases
VSTLIKVGREFSFPVIAIGDRKSPICVWPRGSEFLSLEQQQLLKFRLAKLLPQNHYGRKNLGYLEAISRGASVLFDTDDDNAPLPNWRPRDLRIAAQQVHARGWVNVYRFFTSHLIWPRGIPLENVQDCQKTKLQAGSTETVECPIQQGLVNCSPDVDAIWRMLFEQEINFENATSVWLPPGAWCPFNSQSTWWFKMAFSLLYLPSCVSFRVTDIWRSFIAQRCLWECGCGVAFHAPESVQCRNAHNLLKDFSDEFPGYVGNSEIIATLETIQLAAGAAAIPQNLHRCYDGLVGRGLLPEREMPLLEAWIRDMDDMQGINRSD